MTNVQAMKAFFESPGQREDLDYFKIEMSELKALSIEERNELGKLCAIELGVEIVLPKSK